MLLLLMVTSKGMAGVPRASLVVIAATLAQFNIPEAGLLLILGVDHFLDMGALGHQRDRQQRRHRGGGEVGGAAPARGRDRPRTRGRDHARGPASGQRLSGGGAQRRSCSSSICARSRGLPMRYPWA